MRRVKLDPSNLPKDPTDWEKIRSKSDREVIEAARADPDAAPLTAAQLERFLPVPDVKALRQNLHMTQSEFSRSFKLASGTVRDWEQNRFAPEGPARVLLAVIEKNPRAVKEALEASMPAKVKSRRKSSKTRGAVATNA